jgi:hypothetical protein
MGDSKLDADSRLDPPLPEGKAIGRLDPQIKRYEIQFVSMAVVEVHLSTQTNVTEESNGRALYADPRN